MHIQGWTGKHIGGLSVWQPLDWAKISLQNMSNFKSQLDGIWPIGNGKVQVSVYQRLLPLTPNTLKPYDPLHCCAATLKDLTSIFYHLQCGLSITQATGFCTVVLWCCEWLTVVGRKGPRSTLTIPVIKRLLLHLYKYTKTQIHKYKHTNTLIQKRECTDHTHD